MENMGNCLRIHAKILCQNAYCWRSAMHVRPTFSAYHYGFLKTSCTARVGDFDEIMDVILGIPVWYGRHIT